LIYTLGQSYNYGNFLKGAAFEKFTIIKIFIKNELSKLRAKLLNLSHLTKWRWSLC